MAISDNSEHISLSPIMFYVACLMVSLANFLAIMNTTIANVALPTIAGDLGISYTQGTWIITFYAIAEAITVPLTGWFTKRFGTIKIFVIAYFGFGLASIFCGLSGTLTMLIIGRVIQGFTGGLLMPLSQTMLLRIFPSNKAAAANALWAVTALVGPVIGPILGGVFCNDFSWSWAFYIDAPFAFIGAGIVWLIFKETKVATVKSTIDVVGLGLLIVWVTALQTMLDEGKNLDWFAAKEIWVLAVVTVIGFVSFIIWELTEKNPIVDLRVFRHRTFTMSMLTLAIAYGAFFGVNVLVPQWLQLNMGYTATWCGKTVAWMGVLAVFSAPLAAKLISIIDARVVSFIGIIWIGMTTLWLAMSNNDMTYWHISVPFLLMGIGLPLFFVPIMSIGLSSVKCQETDSATGLMNFVRTLAGAFATSIITTYWEHAMKYNHAELAAVLNPDNSHGIVKSLAREVANLLVTGQSMMLATNNALFILGAVLLIAAFSIWLVPKSNKIITVSGMH